MPHPQIQRQLLSHHQPHVVGDVPDVLYQIRDPGVNLSLWRRPSEAAIAHELASLDASQLPDRRHPTSADSFDDDVVDLLQRQGLDPLNFKRLRVDLSCVAGHFFNVSQGSDAKFRLLTTDADDCRRFHVDTRDLRLLCTYRGPGTQWLRNAQVDREALRRGAPNEDIIRSGEPSEIEPFWVGIMKGEHRGEGSGLVHRSPPLAGSGQTRVLFCLDAEPVTAGTQNLH
jgi:hypothetical protein